MLNNSKLLVKMSLIFLDQDFSDIQFLIDVLLGKEIIYQSTNGKLNKSIT